MMLYEPNKGPLDIELNSIDLAYPFLLDLLPTTQIG